MPESFQGLPFVSVVIPVFNEELVIERRIKNIYQCTYPKNKLEVLVIDSGSKDKTCSIIEEKFPNRVILMREEQRKGKASAINLALEKCKGEIVIITDGPTLYDKDTILQLVESLRNSSVGGATALYNIPNATENQTTASEYTYWSYKDKLRILESRTYSTSWLSGEACAFKKGILTKLDEDTLADDSNIALHLISKGYRVVVNEHCYFTEKSPSEVYDYLRIKGRRALGGLIETLRFRFLLFRPEYGHFGLVIFPYRFFAQFISPIASYIAMVLSIPATFEIGMYFGIYAQLFLGITLLTLGLIFKNKILAYIYLQLITLRAMFLLLTRRADVNWYQSRTTRF
jgi:cellulose synthase/poly-beta-1,6-N-acetylglucosamine synthase-like glycosyltransferase